MQENTNVIYVIESHEQLLDIWRKHNDYGLNVAHFDFHCDMRGLLVDIDSKLAYVIDPIEPLDEGNFLTHALAEGRISSVRWTHYVPGGRKNDVGTVMYTTDFFYRLKKHLRFYENKNGATLQYHATDFSHWDGVLEGEFIDIDWDFFAAKEYSLDSIDRKIEEFFSQKFGDGPYRISLCYSPRYSLPSREKFSLFLTRLAEEFDAEICHVPYEPAPRLRKKRGFLINFFRRIHYNGTLLLRKFDVF